MKRIRDLVFTALLLALLLPFPAFSQTGAQEGSPPSVLAWEELRSLHDLAMEEALGSMSSQETDDLREGWASIGLSLSDIEALYTPDGRATWLSSSLPLARPGDLGLEANEAASDVSLAILDRICPILGCGTGIDRLVVKEVAQDQSGWTTVKLQQMVGDIPVIFSDLRVHIDASNAIRAISSMVSPATSVPTEALLSRDDAVAIADDVTSEGRIGDDNARLVIYDQAVLGKPSQARLVWVHSFEAEGYHSWRVLVDAQSGELVDLRDMVAYLKDRLVWDLGQYCEIGDTECGSHPGSRPASGDCAYCGNVACYYEDATVTGCTDWSGGCSSSEACNRWNESGAVYDYLHSNFTRDGWDGSGSRMWVKVNPPSSACSDASGGANVGGNGKWIYVCPGAGAGVTYHETMHLFQEDEGLYGGEDGSFYRQDEVACHEGSADVWSAMIATNSACLICDDGVSNCNETTDCPLNGNFGINHAESFQSGEDLNPDPHANTGISLTAAWMLGQNDIPQEAGTKEYTFNGVTVTSFHDDQNQDYAGFYHFERIFYGAHVNWFNSSEDFRSYRAKMLLASYGYGGEDYMTQMARWWIPATFTMPKTSS